MPFAARGRIPLRPRGKGAALAQKLRGGGLDGQAERGRVRVRLAVQGAHRLARGFVHAARREHARGGRFEPAAEHGRFAAFQVLQVDEVGKAGGALRPGGVVGLDLAEHEIQRALGAGERHIQQPHLVGGAAAEQAAAHHLAQDRLLAGALLRVVGVRHGAPFVVEQDLLLQVLPGEVAAHARDDDDGELQPLGGVHGHHAHGAVPAALGIPDLVAAAAELFEEGGHGQVPALLGEAADAAHPLLPAGEGEQVRLHARLGEDGGDHLAGALDLHPQPQRRRARIKAAQLFGERVPPLCGVPLAGEVEGLVLAARALAGEADGGELRVRQPAQRAFQRRREGDVLRAVVQKLQQRDHRLDFRIVADVDVRRRGDGDAAAHQLPDDAAGKAGHVAREQDDVAKFGAHLLPRGGVEAEGADFPADDVRDERALGKFLVLDRPQPVRHRIDVPLRGRGLLLFRNERGAHAPARLRGEPRRHHRRVRVIDGAALARHRPRKQAVDRVEHGGAAAEVAVEGERAALAAQPLVFFGEEGGVAAAEAVDGLLRVPDHEHVFPRDEGEDALLHGADVLVLVHEEMGVAAAHLLAHARDGEQAQAAVLEVGKVQPARAALAGGVFRVIGEHRLRKARRYRAREQKVCQLLLPRAKFFEKLLDRVRLLFDVGERLVQRGRLRVARRFDILLARLGGEFEPRKGRRRGKDVGRGEHLLGGGDAPGEEGGVLLAEQPGRAQALAFAQQFFAPRAQPPRRGAHGRERLPRQRGEGIFGVFFRDAREKFAIIRPHDDLLVQLDHPAAQLREAAAGRAGAAEGGKGGRLLRLQLFKGAHGGALAQLVRLLLFQHAESAVDARLVKVAADDVAAEGVQRADIRRGDVGKLRLQTGAAGGVLLDAEAGGERGAQPLLHLPRGEVGERDREHGGDVRLLAEDEGDHLFDHDERLAAARRRGHEHFAGGVDGGLLFGRGFASAHSPFLLRTISAISAGETLLSLRAPSVGSRPQSAPYGQYWQASS